MMDIIILRVPARDVYKREKPRPNDPEQSPITKCTSLGLSLSLN